MDFIAQTIYNRSVSTRPATINFCGALAAAAASTLNSSATIPAVVNNFTARFVVLAIALAANNTTVTGASVAGVPLTVSNYVASGDNNAVAIAYGVLSAGITGSQTVIVSCNGTTSSILASVYICDHITNPAPIATFTSDIPASPVAVSMNSRSNGVVVGVFSSSGSGGAGAQSWTNMTEDYDALSNSRVAATARGLTSGTTFTSSVTCDTSNTNRALMLMTFR